MYLFNYCPVCHRQHTIILNGDAYDRYKKGMPIIKAFPTLNPTEREVIISGYCPDCQEDIFGIKHKSRRIKVYGERKEKA